MTFKNYVIGAYINLDHTTYVKVRTLIRNVSFFSLKLSKS